MNGKRKGTAAELEVAAAYRVAGFRAGRVARSGAGIDRGDVRVPCTGMHIEVKRCERAEIWAWLDQATRDAEPDEIPVVHFRRSHSDWHVALPLDGWLRILALAERGASPTTLRAALLRLDATVLSALDPIGDAA